MSINILGISGSPRGGATRHALRYALQCAAESEDVTIDLVDLAGKDLRPCIHCNACVGKEESLCAVYDDDINPLYEKLLAADVLICASPVYNMNMSPLLSILFSRTKPMSKAMRHGAFALKVGVAIAVGGRRNGGQELVINAMNNAFLSTGMLVCGGGVFSYHGAPVWSNDEKEDGVMNDSQGLARLNRVSRRAVAMARVVAAGADALGDEAGLSHFGFSDQDEWERTMASFYD